MSLAEEFGLHDYPAPAGGCLLTEPIFAYRLKDLLTFNPSPSLRDIALLKRGRHFRLSPACKLVLGRDMAENEMIESLSADGEFLLTVEGCGSPVALLAAGKVTEEDLNRAAALCARYSDAKSSAEVEVTVRKGDTLFTLVTSPAGKELVEALRIEKGAIAGKPIS
jgi:hypothetical protein